MSCVLEFSTPARPAIKKTEQMSRIARLIRTAINSTGYDLHRINAASLPSVQLLKALNRFNVDLVLDVGANTGQFASELFHRGFDGKIVSFEPLTSAHSRLIRNSRRSPAWIVHPRCAIGDRDGDTMINISGNSVSSSLLPMLDSHAFAAPGSAYGSAEPTPISRLDSVAPAYVGDSNRLLVKIDTQGFESQVLDGATATLARAVGVLCELSLVPLYEGQALWTEMISRLAKEGFSLWALQQGFVDSADGRTLQLDGLFFRTDG